MKPGFSNTPHQIDQLAAPCYEMWAVERLRG